LRRTALVVFCAVDPFLGARGELLLGFEDFASALENAGIPCVWISQRTRGQLDAPRRKLGARDPFIAEGGCGIYLPEDCFHQSQARTVRLGRYLCIPVAQTQPASAEALEKLARESQIEVVPLKSLRPKELAQNAGLPGREAELMRARDFDELFFFAGANDAEIQRFLHLGEERGLAIRSYGNLWSMAVGASINKCVQQLARLYEQPRRKRALRVGIAVGKDVEPISSACDRVLRIVSGESTNNLHKTDGATKRQYLLSSPYLWEEILAELQVGD
jgi:predicted mannosyl-3-phosphoglycerate phosphatase (HAD superfamily)